jgi:apolipoprotein N-acyltransferase
VRAVLHKSWPVVAATASAALIVLSAPGVVPWPAASLLAWVAFAPILLALQRLSMRGAVLVGWWGGVLVNAGLSCWMPGVLARFSALPPWLAIAASVPLWAWSGLTWAAWAGCVGYLRAYRWAPVAGACVLVALERFLPVVFPYSLGITQYRNLWIAQGAEFGGPYLLTLLMVLSGAAVARSLTMSVSRCWAGWPVAAAGLALPLLVAGAGALRLASISEAWQAAPVFRVGVVQAGQVQTGWQAQPDPPDLLARYQELSSFLQRQEPAPELLVWPEKAYPLLIRRDAAHDYPVGNDRRVRRGFDAPLVFGANAVQVDTRELSNAAFLLDSEGRVRGLYEKVILIPYSEWVPGILHGRIPGGKRYLAGSRREPLELATAAHGPVRLGTFICFESAFPHHVRALMGHEPDVLLNLSDDTWFGDGAEPEQHLAHVVFRAIEARRDIVRATGAGISAWVAATGEVVRSLPVDAGAPGGATLVAEARLLKQRSFQARWGHLFPWACAAAAVAMLAGGWRRARVRA